MFPFPTAPLAGQAIFGQNSSAEFMGLLSGVDNRKFPFELSFFQGFPQKKEWFFTIPFSFFSASTLYCRPTAGSASFILFTVQD
jgi:hypothetical protein